MQANDEGGQSKGGKINYAYGEPASDDPAKTRPGVQSRDQDGEWKDVEGTVGHGGYDEHGLTRQHSGAQSGDENHELESIKDVLREREARMRTSDLSWDWRDDEEVLCDDDEGFQEWEEERQRQLDEMEREERERMMVRLCLAFASACLSFLKFCVRPYLGVKWID